ncbi:Transcriptional regulator KdgR [compost metagenome]
MSEEPTTMFADGEAAGTGTLGKAMAVLEAVVMADGPQRFTDILARSGQPRGTLHRLLSHLVEEGLLVQRRDLCYEPGLRLLTLAYRSWSGNRFRDVAEPHLRKLHELTGETVHLGILRETEIVYVDKVESRQTVRMSSQIGKASPAYCTGIGKAALSLLGQPELEGTGASCRQDGVPCVHPAYASLGRNAAGGDCRHPPRRTRFRSGRT